MKLLQKHCDEHLMLVIPTHRAHMARDPTNILMDDHHTNHIIPNSRETILPVKIFYKCVDK